MFQTALLLTYISSTLANAVCTQLHGFLGDNSGGLESVVHLKSMWTVHDREGGASPLSRAVTQYELPLEAPHP